MSDDRWIVVPNWDKFQHYGNRSPIWIKTYLELFSRDDYLELVPTARALLHCIWAHYALARGVLRASSVQGACRLRAKREHWESLSDAGFIQLRASKPLALSSRARSREVEVEVEKRRPVAHAPKAKPDSEHRENAAAYKPYRPEPDEPVDPELARELARQLANRYDR